MSQVGNELSPLTSEVSMNLSDPVKDRRIKWLWYTTCLRVIFFRRGISITGRLGVNVTLNLSSHSQAIVRYFLYSAHAQ